MGKGVSGVAYSALTIERLKRNVAIMTKSSSVGESHPHALTDTDVNLSAHPAPIDQP